MERSSMSMGASIMAHQELVLKLRALQHAESYASELSEYTKQLRSEIMSFVSEQVDVPTGSVIKELGGEILFYYAEVFAKGGGKMGVNALSGGCISSTYSHLKV